MKNEIIERLEIYPIVGAVSDQKQLQNAVASDLEIIFLVGTDIFNIENHIKMIKEAGKMVFVHFDLVEGLSNDTTALKFIHNTYKPDGFITTKSNIVKYAKQNDILIIQRIFLIDSINVRSGLKLIEKLRPNAVEILPGVAHKFTKEIVRKSGIPVITSGLIMDKEDIISCLESGATGISTSAEHLWDS